jgi:type IV pilus assembly protein PilC
VVPQFEDVFKNFGAELPAFTQLIVSFSRFLVSYWWIMLFAVVGSVTAFIFAYKRSPGFQHFLDRVILKVPVIGQIMHNSAIARFARTLATTFKAGVPLVEALESVAGATGNAVYEKAVWRIRDDVSVGYPVNMAMKQVNLFPHMVIQMSAIGEEAGALDSMLFKVAEFYEQERGGRADQPAGTDDHGHHRRAGGQHGRRHVPADLQAGRGRRRLIAGPAHRWHSSTRTRPSVIRSRPGSACSSAVFSTW